MIEKDRYSQAIILFVVLVILSILFLRTGKKFFASASMLAAPAYMAYLFTRPGRVHLSDKYSNRNEEIFGAQNIVAGKPSIQFKGENDCGFSADIKSEVDGIYLRNERYKVVNGADVYVDENNHIKPVGFGSAVMQILVGGGVEPKAIQQDACWKVS